jgi:hypothetical protein
MRDQGLLECSSFAACLSRKKTAKSVWGKPSFEFWEESTLQVAEGKEIKDFMVPTLGAKTKTRRGWGTHISSPPSMEQQGATGTAIVSGKYLIWEISNLNGKLIGAEIHSANGELLMGRSASSHPGRSQPSSERQRLVPNRDGTRKLF